MIHRLSFRSVHPGLPFRFLLLALVVAWSGAQAIAQGHPGGGPGGGPPGGGGGQPGSMGGPGSGPGGGYPNGFPNDNSRSAPPPNSRDSQTTTMRGGLQLGPPGRWWNDDAFAKSIGLNRDQQHRMDDIFKANKGQLLTLFKGLQHEESQLEKISRAHVLDEAQIDAQIDKVVIARGDLEKANVHMLLDIRRQMTPDQITRLDEHRPSPPPNDN